MVMRMTIKEIKAKGKKDDKIKFTAKVKNVYDAKELTPEQKAKAKYTFSRQNAIVEDGTDSIQVIISHKDKESEYKKDIIGKEIEVDGKITFWEGKMKIFGKLLFKIGEAPVSKDNSTIIKSATVSVLPAGIELRKISLGMAIEFWGSRIGHEKDEEGVIETADKFKAYLIEIDKIKKSSGRKKEQKEEKPKEEESKELEGTKSEEQVIKINNVPLIDEIMQLKEDHHLDAETFAVHCNKKDIKTLSIEELKALKVKLENLTEEIPF